MGEWHAVEVFCPACQAWRRTGAATTRENFDSDIPKVLGGRCALPCGHVVVVEDRELLRFGPKLQGNEA